MIWQEDEIELLRAFIETGYTHKEIANELDRTLNSVRLKASKLKFKSKNSVLKTHEQYVKELSIKNPTIIVLEEYKGGNTNILHQCLICYKDSMCTPSHKLEGIACKFCAGKLLKTHEQYVLDLAKKCSTMIVLEQYINTYTAILHKCLICGEESICKPRDKLSGKACVYCKNKGFNWVSPATTYLIDFYTINVIKPGVTRKTIKQRYKEEPLPYEIILEHHFDTGREALDLEELWLENTKHLQINTGLLRSGNTETFRDCDGD